MNINKKGIQKVRPRFICYFLIVIFFTFLNQYALTQTYKSEERGLELVEEGKRLYLLEGKYCESIYKYKEAEVLIKLKLNLAQLYIERSKSEYAIDRDCRTGKARDREKKEQMTTQWIRKALNIYCKISDYVTQNRRLFPQGWLNIYDSIVTEYVNREIQLEPSLISFEALEEESIIQHKFLKIKNSGKGTIDFKIQADKSWIKVDQEYGEVTRNGKKLIVSVDNSGMSLGKYTGTLLITSDCVAISPQIVSISLEIIKPPPPVIELDKEALFFEVIGNKISPDSQKFSIKNKNKGKLEYYFSSDVDWIIYPKSGVCENKWNPLLISIGPSKPSDLPKLPKGEYEYKGVLKVNSDNAKNSPREIQIYLRIKPSIQVDKKYINLRLIKDKKEQTLQKIRVRNLSRGKLNYQISSDTFWISVYPKSGWGTSTGEWDACEIKVDSSNLEVGKYKGILIIESNYAINSKQKININLTVESPFPMKTTLGIYGGSYNPQSNIFKQIYRKKSLFGGLELSFPIFLRGLDMWTNFNYMNFDGKSTFTEENSKLIIRNFSLGIRLLINKKPFFPFVGAGPTYFSYKEEYYTEGLSILPKTGSSYGYHFQGGVYLGLEKSFLIKIFFKYNNVKAKENDLKNINLSGLEYGAGIVFNF